jgi:hypothetical protein
MWPLGLLFCRILKSGDEMLTISGFFCHGENIFIQMETTAPPPRRKKRKKIGIRYVKNSCEIIALREYFVDRAKSYDS